MSDKLITKVDLAKIRADYIVKAKIGLIQWLIGGVGFGGLLLIMK